MPHAIRATPQRHAKNSFLVSGRFDPTRLDIEIVAAEEKNAHFHGPLDGYRLEIKWENEFRYSFGVCLCVEFAAAVKTNPQYSSHAISHDQRLWRLEHFAHQHLNLFMHNARRFVFIVIATPFRTA